jgi:hypothetical protein
MKHARKIISLSVFLLVLLLIASNQTSWAKRAVPDDLIVHPVLITLLNNDNKKQSFGSGFYFINTDNNIYLITASHVFFGKDQNMEEGKLEKGKKQEKKKDKESVKKAPKEEKDEIKLKSKKASLLSYPNDLNWSKPQKYELNLENLHHEKSLQYDGVNDIAIVQMTQDGSHLVNGVKRLTGSIIVTVPLENIKLYDDVLVGNDVYISGFPASLGIKKLKQIDYNRPLLRKGIIAGKNDSKKTITIDCSSYGGNSGGPVIEIEQISLRTFNIRVIGIIIQFVPYAKKRINIQQGHVNVELGNSGYTVVVPMDPILKLINKFSN